MAGINPISGITPHISPIAGKGGAEAAESTQASNFGEMFRNCLDKVEQQQQASGAAMTDLLTGNSQDVLPAISAMAKADMSFKLLMGVRNKVIEAYKQTMNMQI